MLLKAKTNILLQQAVAEKENTSCSSHKAMFLFLFMCQRIQMLLTNLFFFFFLISSSTASSFSQLFWEFRITEVRPFFWSHKIHASEKSLTNSLNWQTCKLDTPHQCGLWVAHTITELRDYINCNKWTARRLERRCSSTCRKSEPPCFSCPPTISRLWRGCVSDLTEASFTPWSVHTVKKLWSVGFHR